MGHHAGGRIDHHGNHRHRRAAEPSGHPSGTGDRHDERRLDDGRSSEPVRQPRHASGGVREREHQQRNRHGGNAPGLGAASARTMISKTRRGTGAASLPDGGDAELVELDRARVTNNSNYYGFTLGGNRHGVREHARRWDGAFRQRRQQRQQSVDVPIDPFVGERGVGGKPVRQPRELQQLQRQHVGERPGGERGEHGPHGVGWVRRWRLCGGKRHFVRVAVRGGCSAGALDRPDSERGGCRADSSQTALTSVLRGSTCVRARDGERVRRSGAPIPAQPSKQPMLSTTATPERAA